MTRLILAFALAGAMTVGAAGSAKARPASEPDPAAPGIIAILIGMVMPTMPATH